MISTGVPDPLEVLVRIHSNLQLSGSIRAEPQRDLRMQRPRHGYPASG